MQKVIVTNGRREDDLARQAPLSGTAILAEMRLREFQARAFHRGTHAMNGEAERDRAAAKADAIALLTILQETTQSRSIAERCAKAKAVLG